MMIGIHIGIVIAQSLGFFSKERFEKMTPEMLIIIHIGILRGHHRSLFEGLV